MDNKSERKYIALLISVFITWICIMILDGIYHALVIVVPFLSCLAVFSKQRVQDFLDFDNI